MEPQIRETGFNDLPKEIQQLIAREPDVYFRLIQLSKGVKLRLQSIPKEIRLEICKKPITTKELENYIILGANSIVLIQTDKLNIDKLKSTRLSVSNVEEIIIIKDLIEINKMRRKKSRNIILAISYLDWAKCEEFFPSSKVHGLLAVVGSDYYDKGIYYLDLLTTYNILRMRTLCSDLAKQIILNILHEWYNSYVNSSLFNRVYLLMYLATNSHVVGSQPQPKTISVNFGERDYLSLKEETDRIYNGLIKFFNSIN